MHVARFVERYGTDLAHRPKLGDDAQDTFGLAKHPRRELRKSIQPLGPRAGRPATMPAGR